MAQVEKEQTSVFVQRWTEPQVNLWLKISGYIFFFNMTFTFSFCMGRAELSGKCYPSGMVQLETVPETMYLLAGDFWLSFR